MQGLVLCPPHLHLLLLQGRICPCRNPKFASCGDSKAPVPGPLFLVVWESGRGLSILPVPSRLVQDWCPRYKRGLPCPHGRIPSPQRLQRVPGRTGVCLSALLCTNSCFCKYVSHEQLAPTVTRSHLCRAVRGSCSFAGTEDELKQPTVPSLPPSWGDHRSAKCPLSAPELGASV